MPVFDFNDAPDKKNPAECTYTTFQSSEPEASPEKPILILDNSRKKWQHHSCGMLPIRSNVRPLNFMRRTAPSVLINFEN